MAAPTVTAPRVIVDPGYLFWAPLGSTVPVGGGTMAGSVFTDVITTPWIWLGATVDGSEFTNSIAVEYVRAAEIFDPIGSSVTERTTTFGFSLMDITATRMQYVMNGGTITVASTGATQINKFTPPAVSGITRRMLAWESTSNDLRVFLFQTINTGDITTQFRKAPAAAALPVSLTAEVPAGTSVAWESYGNQFRG